MQNNKANSISRNKYSDQFADWLVKLGYTHCFYLGGGISTQNGISMFSETYNRRNNGKLAHFYNERISGAIFINIGLTVKFGKTKSIYNNYNLYDAIDLNNSSEAGDNNINTGNPEIPKSKNKIKDVKLSDIQDLIETQDLY